MINDFYKDWRIKDNLTIAINILNKNIINNFIEEKKECKKTQLYKFDVLLNKTIKLAERHKISLLEASIIIKQEIKKGNIECLNKNYKI